MILFWYSNNNTISAVVWPLMQSNNASAGWDLDLSSFRASIFLHDKEDDDHFDVLTHSVCIGPLVVIIPDVPSLWNRHFRVTSLSLSLVDSLRYSPANVAAGWAVIGKAAHALIYSSALHFLPQSNCPPIFTSTNVTCIYLNHNSVCYIINYRNSGNLCVVKKCEWDKFTYSI